MYSCGLVPVDIFFSWAEIVCFFSCSVMSRRVWFLHSESSVLCSRAYASRHLRGVGWLWYFYILFQAFGSTRHEIMYSTLLYEDAYVGQNGRVVFVASSIVWMEGGLGCVLFWLFCLICVYLIYPPKFYTVALYASLKGKKITSWMIGLWNLFWNRHVCTP